MDAVKLGFGERYSDGSGWEWLVELDTERDGTNAIKLDLGGTISFFSPDAISPRQVALALNLIADTLGFDVLDEQIEAAREMVGDELPR